MDYVEPPDCPAGMTLRAWRAEHRPEPARRAFRGRLRLPRLRRSRSRG
jgi:hypothetical protein